MFIDIYKIYSNRQQASQVSRTFFGFLSFFLQNARVFQLTHLCCVWCCRNRIVQKRINVRIEHVKHSRCREDFLNRVKANELKRQQAKEKGERAVCKRQPVGPRLGHFVRAGGKEPELVEPIPYEFVA